jgi:hypothetical protein
MRTSCGRSDGEPTKQTTEIPRAFASSRRLSPPTDYYNRLEYSRWFRLLCAAARSSIFLSAVAVKPPSGVVTDECGEISAPQAFLSLPQGRESSHQQLWGITPLTRGIA